MVSSIKSNEYMVRELDSIKTMLNAIKL